MHSAAPVLPLSVTDRPTSSSITPTILYPVAEHSGEQLESVAAGPRPLELPKHASSPNPAPAIDNSIADLATVFGKETPATVAPIQPPVGEQILLDVAVSEAPALPLVTAPESAAQPNSPQVAPSQVPVIAEPKAQILDKKSPETAPEVASIIPTPRSLVDGFKVLTDVPLTKTWALEAITLLDRIHAIEDLGTPGAADLLQQLTTLLQQTPQIGERTDDLTLRALILRVGYAAKRRVDIWRQVQRIIATGQANSLPVLPSNMTSELSAVERRLMEAEHAAEWQQYLLLAEVRRLSESGSAEARRNLAKRVLKRIDSPQLSEGQIDVFTKPPFDRFTSELRRWASEPIDYLRLLDDLEQFERETTMEAAAAITACYDTVRWSPHEQQRKLAELLNTHYRNANVRVALTADFLNRLLPEPQAIEENINDNIVGADVYGVSRTVNRLQVVLQPDEKTWRIGLEAHGEIASDTSASKGPATFYNQGFARYHARKLLMVDRRGIRVWRAEVDANSESNLTGFETELDAFPVIGMLARSIARSQHDQQWYEAKLETDQRVRDRASTRFDDEVHERLSSAEQRVKQKLIAPFDRLDLKPTPLDMATTEQRVIARYRLASDRQLAAFTPRPQAPWDSLLSVQIHESALNNTLANLKLEGRRTDLRALYQELAETFERPDLQVPDDIPDNVTIQFAEKEAVRVRCDEGRVFLTIQIAELKNGRSKWTDFGVHAQYVPDAEQLNANLVRDGVIEISGERTFDRFPLRGIFSKVLSKTRAVNIVNKKLGENPTLHDLHVNQFVINDGWIGVAIGPGRAGDLDQLARKKQLDERR